MNEAKERQVEPANCPAHSTRLHLTASPAQAGVYSRGQAACEEAKTWSFRKTH